MINIQPIEKQDIRDDFSLDVHSIFHTIQGEGPLTGHPAIFIRLAGCNLQCPKCDTDYTSKRQRMTPEGILAAVRKLHAGPRLVVITGGEPFRQNLTMLCTLLVDEDYMVQIETNGTLPVSEGLPQYPHVWIVVSPKASKVHPSIEERALAWKYVASHLSMAPDGLPIRALEHHCSSRGVARPPEGFVKEAIYLQPVDAQNPGVNGRNLRSVIASCMQHGYTLQLQVHKLINME